VFRFDSESRVYAASAGFEDCQTLFTVVGFNASEVEARLSRETEATSRFEAENADIVFEDGAEREPEPEDFPMWETGASEFRVSEVVSEDAMRDLARDGIAVVSHW
jgi:hypothetical protein